AHRNLAQSIWMRTGDIAVASEHLDAALRSHPDADDLYVVKASLLEGAGDARSALALLAPRADRPSAGLDLLLSASSIALVFEPADALAFARRAQAIAPLDASARATLAHALLATGDPAQAERITTGLLADAPDDQGLIAVRTTAWRLLGDPRYHACC